MEKTKRYKYIIALLTAFLLTVVGFFALQAPQSAKADIEDVYFSAGVSSATQSTKKLAFYLCWDENMVGELQEARISFSMPDTTGCKIENALITPSDFEDYGGKVRVVVTVEDPNKVVRLKAVVTMEEFGQITEYTTYSPGCSLLHEWKQTIADEEGVLDFAEDVLFEIKRIIAAEESGFYLKAESGVYINIYDYEQSEDRNVDLSVKNTVYRIKDLTTGSTPYVLEFRICENGNKYYYTQILVEHDDIYSGSGISILKNDTPYWYNGNIDAEKITVLGANESIISYWRDENYEYFTFPFLEALPEDAELISCNAYYANVDVALMSSDTEYTESLLAEINNWKNQYETLLASVTEKEEEIERCYQKINKLETEISELNDKITQRDEEIASLNTELDEANAAISELIIGNARLSQELEQLKGTKEEQASRIRELELAMELANGMLEAGLETKHKLEAQIATLQSEKEALTNERDLNLSLYNAANQQIATLEAEKKDLNAEIERLNGLLSIDVSTLNTLISEKNKQIERLEKELEEAKKQANKKEDKDENTLPTFGCGSINTGSGSGAGGIASLMATVATTMILFYIGVNYARKKKQN